MDVNLDYYRPLVIQVREEDAGREVRKVLQKHFGISRKLLSQVKLTEHGLTVNDQRVYTTAKVSEGDVIRLRMVREESLDILPESIPIEIVFEDESLLIVNKPAGMIVHPTHGHYTGTLANAVVKHWQEQGEKIRFRPIHRLDEDTSGLVAIAKTSYIHQQVSEQLQAGQVMKLYRAYVYGKLQPAAGTIDAPIDRDPDRTHIRIVTPEGYPSVTHYETIRYYTCVDGDASAVSLKLETGRTHQIRVHMQYQGCPLIGDKFYGNQEGCVDEWEQVASRHALHAETLGFMHPITRERMTWHAPLPSELIELEKRLEGSIDTT